MQSLQYMHHILGKFSSLRKQQRIVTYLCRNIWWLCCTTCDLGLLKAFRTQEDPYQGQRHYKRSPFPTAASQIWIGAWKLRSLPRSPLFLSSDKCQILRRKHFIAQNISYSFTKIQWIKNVTPKNFIHDNFTIYSVCIFYLAWLIKTRRVGYMHETKFVIIFCIRTMVLFWCTTVMMWLVDKASYTRAQTKQLLWFVSV